MRKLNKNIKDKTNLMLFLLMSIFTLTLTVGYSAINSELTVTGEANFRIMEGTRITNVSLYETTNNGIESYKSKFSSDSITLGVDLQELGSTVTYEVQVTNFGTVAMSVSSISPSSNSNANSMIETIGYNSTDLINPGTTKTIYIKIKYKNNVSTLPNITAVNLILGFEYITPTSTLAAGNTNGSTGTFFNSGPIQKGQVESIEFLPTLEVGEEALGFWDASYEMNGTVMAWYTNIDEDNLYELYIGGNGKVYAPANSDSLFRNFNKVESITFDNYFDTSNVTLTGTMFYNCSKLGTLDLNNFNTSKVGYMQNMFYGCSYLTQLTFGNSFNTSNVKNMQNMFSGCSSLTTLDVSNFNTSKVTTMAGMFERCSKLTTLDLSKFDTSKTTSIVDLCYNCSSLTSITFGEYFNTSNLTSIRRIFYNCSKLTTLDLSNFNTDKVTNMQGLFQNCTRLTNLDIRNFSFTSVTNNTDTFTSVLASCSIIVNTNVERDWLLNVRNDFTNIKIVAELEEL